MWKSQRGTPTVKTHNRTQHGRLDKGYVSLGELIIYSCVHVRFFDIDKIVEYHRENSHCISYH